MKCKPLQRLELACTALPSLLQSDSMPIGTVATAAAAKQQHLYVVGRRPASLALLRDDDFFQIVLEASGWLS
jgi:hypothetical protein